MALEIPTRSDLGAFRETVELDGQLYQFEFRWNERDGLWKMDILTESGDAIVAGHSLVPDVDLLGSFLDERLPPGRFVAEDLSGRGEPAGENDLGDRVVLVYISNTELVAGGFAV